MKRKSANSKLISALYKPFRNVRRTKGIAVLWAAITLLVLILFMGIAIDAARVHLAANQLQNAADAAALAGARWVPDPNSSPPGYTAQQKAIEYAGYNYAADSNVHLFPNPSNDPDGDIVIGRFINQLRIFIPTMDTPNAMKVAARKQANQANEPLPLVFGPIVHVNTANIERFATAMVINAYESCIICCCSKSDVVCGGTVDDVCIYFHGNPDVNVGEDCSIWANSVDIDAADLRGSPNIHASEFNVVGDVSISGNYDFETDFTYHEIPATLNTNLGERIECPYENLSEPDFPQLPSPSATDGNTVKITGGTHTLKPGYYPGGIEISGDTTVVTLDPGIYQVNGTATSGGLSITGGSTTANGVMFHIVGGKVDIRGNTQLILSPPTSGPYSVDAGISIFQSRSNCLDGEINGGGGLDMYGALYFPSNHVYISGNGDTMGSRLIACTIEFAGTGEINVGYAGEKEIANSSFLVE